MGARDDDAPVSAVELVERYRAGTLSPVEALESSLARIAERDDAV